MTYNTALTVSITLFILGVGGLIRHRRRILGILLSLELMILAIGVHWVFQSHSLGDVTGHGLTLFLLAIASAESAVGLVLLMFYHRHHSRQDLPPPPDKVKSS